MNKKIVYCDRIFDLFHSGHIQFLKSCKEIGDYLIVGVISDENVRSYKRTPILSLKDRVTILQHIDFVDEVVANYSVQLLSKDFLKKKN